MRRTVFVISRDEPPQGSDLVKARVQHSEDPTWESKVWKVASVSGDLDRRLELSERQKAEIRPGFVTHSGPKAGRYEVLGLAYCQGELPKINPNRVGVFYRALYRSTNCHGPFWFRPLWGRGGWFVPLDGKVRFVRADKEHAAA
mgnify:FL=1